MEDTLAYFQNLHNDFGTTEDIVIQCLQVTIDDLIRDKMLLPIPVCPPKGTKGTIVAPTNELPRHPLGTLPLSSAEASPVKVHVKKESPKKSPQKKSESPKKKSKKDKKEQKEHKEQQQAVIVMDEVIVVEKQEHVEESMEPVPVEPPQVPPPMVFEEEQQERYAQQYSSHYEQIGDNREQEVTYNVTVVKREMVEYSEQPQQKPPRYIEPEPEYVPQQQQQQRREIEEVKSSPNKPTISTSYHQQQWQQTQTPLPQPIIKKEPATPPPPKPEPATSVSFYKPNVAQTQTPEKVVHKAEDTPKRVVFDSTPSVSYPPPQPQHTTQHITQVTTSQTSTPSRVSEPAGSPASSTFYNVGSTSPYQFHTLKSVSETLSEAGHSPLNVPSVSGGSAACSPSFSLALAQAKMERDLKEAESRRLRHQQARAEFFRAMLASGSLYSRGSTDAPEFDGSPFKQVNSDLEQALSKSTYVESKEQKDEEIPIAMTTSHHSTISQPGRQAQAEILRRNSGSGKSSKDTSRRGSKHGQTPTKEHPSEIGVFSETMTMTVIEPECSKVLVSDSPTTVLKSTTLVHELKVEQEKPCEDYDNIDNFTEQQQPIYEEVRKSESRHSNLSKGGTQQEPSFPPPKSESRHSNLSKKSSGEKVEQQQQEEFTETWETTGVVQQTPPPKSESRHSNLSKKSSGGKVEQEQQEDFETYTETWETTERIPVEAIPVASKTVSSRQSSRQSSVQQPEEEDHTIGTQVPRSASQYSHKSASRKSSQNYIESDLNLLPRSESQYSQHSIKEEHVVRSSSKSSLQKNSTTVAESQLQDIPQSAYSFSHEQSTTHETVQHEDLPSEEPVPSSHHSNKSSRRSSVHQQEIKEDEPLLDFGSPQKETQSAGMTRSESQHSRKSSGSRKESNGEQPLGAAAIVRSSSQYSQKSNGSAQNFEQVEVASELIRSESQYSQKSSGSQRIPVAEEQVPESLPRSTSRNSQLSTKSIQGSFEGSDMPRSASQNSTSQKVETTFETSENTVISRSISQHSHASNGHHSGSRRSSVHQQIDEQQEIPVEYGIPQSSSQHSNVDNGAKSSSRRSSANSQQMADRFVQQQQLLDFGDGEATGDAFPQSGSQHSNLGNDPNSSSRRSSTNSQKMAERFLQEQIRFEDNEIVEDTEIIGDSSLPHSASQHSNGSGGIMSHSIHSDV